MPTAESAIPLPFPDHPEVAWLDLPFGLQFLEETRDHEAPVRAAGLYGIQYIRHRHPDFRHRPEVMVGVEPLTDHVARRHLPPGKRLTADDREIFPREVALRLEIRPVSPHHDRRAIRVVRVFGAE